MIKFNRNFDYIVSHYYLRIKWKEKLDRIR